MGAQSKLGLLVAFVFCGSVGRSEEPRKVTVCDLKGNPAEYNHALVEVAAFAWHGFENFTLFDPNCSSWPEVWLEYGGGLSSGTIYCCGVGPERNRPQQFVVEDIVVPLISDDRLREFDRLIQRPPDSIVHATVIGRFFSGRLHRDGEADPLPGYGHMGCCSLLVIQHVLSVDPRNRMDLDYSAHGDEPKTGRSCGIRRDLISTQSLGDHKKTQQAADVGVRSWVLDDPRRVALDTLRRFAVADENSFKQTRKTPVRFVYAAKGEAKGTRYTVVVSRPYWLSFYASDPQKVAWVAIAVYEVSCSR